MVKFHEYKMAQQMHNYYTEYMLIIANITQKNEGKDLNLMSDVNLKKKDWESYFKEGNGMEWRQQNIR